MKDEAVLTKIVVNLLDAWTTQDPERVLACYTDDVIYRDPNTRGEVRGSEAMRRYLVKLFANWTMTWTLREAHAFAEGDGAAVLWHATFKRPGGSVVVEADGMDLMLFDGDRVAKNEVYFDRAALAPLLG